jgi:hypothetical protein
MSNICSMCIKINKVGKQENVTKKMCIYVQLSRQTGSRNLTDQKTLSTIWYTYMMLVTKYQISATNSY